MKIQARAFDLPTLLDDAPAGLSYLSLDCFDTLLWRNVQAPRDVFADLDVPGGGIGPRMWAEKSARKQARFERGGGEVSIEEIYARMYPHASPEERDAALARELDAEARHCFGFAPVLELIRDAKARGLGVIVVSDTYLSEPQLRILIARAAGDEVAALIDRIFCSSEHGLAKGEGLFGSVLEALGAAPETILHVGDNTKADRDAPAKLGIHAVHFQQFDPVCAQRLRLEGAASAMIDPAVRSAVPIFQPHRAQLSLAGANDPAWRLGHDVMGPLLHAFATWVKDEIDALAARTGKPVHPLFLLRDGHLPMRVFEALFPDISARAIEISRFAAARAALDEQAVRRCVASEVDHGRTDVIARQLGIGAGEFGKYCRGRKGREASRAFAQSVLVPSNLRKILARASDFADRLAAHVRAAGVAEGDAVMLIDLGYNGSVQNLVEPLLRNRLGVEIAGRYLLFRAEEQVPFDKAGLLDTRHYDAKAIHALTGCIAVVEQICTIAQGSVVDYRPDGSPIRKDADLKGRQNEVRDRIQDGCVAFAREAGKGMARAPASDDRDARRQMAMGVLARLLFLPSAEEVAVFDTFDHDVNLGTSDLVKLLDADASAEGLRRRGLSYLNTVGRMYLPGELQAQGLPLSLSLFGVSRFGLDLRSSDFAVGTIKLPVIMVDQSSQAVIEVDAFPTHDGFYLATVPVGAGRFSVGIPFGQPFEWVQIEDAAFHPVDGFAGKEGRPSDKRIDAMLIHEGMSDEGGGLYRCGEGGLTLVPPPQGTDGEPHLLAIVFRPVVRRGATVRVAQAA